MKTKPTNWQEMLKLAKVMFESGKHQADLREKFGDVRGQKLFYLLMLNQAFPSVKLFDLTDKELMQLHFAKLIRLGNRICVNSLARIQRQDATDGRELTQPLTEKEFRDWIDEQLKRPQRPDRKTKEEEEEEEEEIDADTMFGKTKYRPALEDHHRCEDQELPVIMCITNLEAGATKFPNPIIRDVFKAVLANNIELLNKYLP